MKFHENFQDGHLETKVDQKFWVSLWEAMLYRYFKAQEFEFKKGLVNKSGQCGPDFGLIHEGRTIWIEAIVPEPTEIPASFLQRRLGQVYDVPINEIKLRWTQALLNKLRQCNERLGKSVIDPRDAYVVVVNCCMISSEPGHEYDSNQLPFALTSVYPVGPIEIPVEQTIDGPKFCKARLSTRDMIVKKNNSLVATDSFLNTGYDVISALIGSNRCEMLDGSYYPTVVQLF